LIIATRRDVVARHYGRYASQRIFNGRIERFVGRVVIHQEEKIDIGVVIYEAECGASTLPAGDNVGKWFQCSTHCARNLIAERPFHIMLAKFGL
jgi:hypothetical protein